uniref:ribosomal protein L9 n=1 Tax=Campylaephora boydenii TaxID=202204 RepID=UPI002551E884|nr:ribosomal protein L9 [Campylaephora boydenii]WGT74144.1 ribosomal protein L9 [Campylaephora boydenii]
MGKHLTVIVKKTHPQIGNTGDIVKLSAGYIFNYLIPNNIVEIPTQGKIKHFQMFNTIEKTKKQNAIIKAQNTKQKIENIYKINITKKIGNKQHIFGSVNEKEVLSKIIHQTNQKLEKKDIGIPEIKQIGIFNLTIKYLDNKKYNLLLQVVPSNI